MSRNYPDWIKAYMYYSRHSEAPDRCHFWTAVSTIAGTLQRCVWIDQKHFQWTPNFYIVLVAPAGIISKSTTAKIGMDLLKRVKGIHFGPSAVTWQKLVQELAESHQQIAIDGAYYPMSAVTISSSEMGSFLKPQDREMVDVLVDLWDGQIGVFEKATKTSGDDSIVNPWLNIIACTTPDWIADNFPEYMIGGGFFSRTIFVYAEEKRHYTAYLDDVVDKDFLEIRDKLVQDLIHIHKNVRGKMTIDPEAKAWGREWYEKNYAEKPAHLSSDRVASYMARRQTHMHKLAMVLSAAQRDDRIITKDHLIAANLLLEQNEYFLPRVFEKIGNDATQAANSIVNVIAKNPGITKDEAFRRLFHTMSLNQFREGLESAIAARHVIMTQDAETKRTVLRVAGGN